MKDKNMNRGGYFRKLNHRQGFTLLELMAVVVILGMIALITVPVITKTIRETRKNSFKTSMVHLLEAANNYYADKQLEMNGTVSFDFLEGGLNEKGEELAFQGTKPSSGKVVINSKGEVTFQDVSNGEYYANYQDGDSDIVVTEDNSVLTRDELTERLKQLEDKVEKQAESSKEFEDNLFNKTYPIGSIYISYSSTNPSDLFGGTWENYGSGRVLRGISSGNAGTTGGAEKVTLKEENLPSHRHSIPALSGSAASAGGHTHTFSVTSGAAGAHTPAGSISTKSLTGTADFRDMNNSDHNTIISSTGILSIKYNSWASSHQALALATKSSGYYLNQLNINATHNHTFTGTAVGNHTHSVSGTTANSGAHTHTVTTTASNTGYTGSATAFSTVDPYITVYMWRRTA